MSSSEPVLGLKCKYCSEPADVLVGPLAAPKFQGWVRYSCKNGHRFALPAVDAVGAVPASVQTGRVQPRAAEDAGAVGPEEGRDDEVPGLERPDVAADGLDDADELVPHAAPGLLRRHRLVRPEVAAADRGAGDAHERVAGLVQPGVGDVLDADVAGAVHDCGFHADTEAGPRVR